MGVDTKIYLPRSVRFDDLCTVLGILSGGEPIKKEFYTTDGFYVKVDNINNRFDKPYSGYINITCKGDVVKMNEHASAFYYGEVEYPNHNYFLILFGCREYSQKIAEGLVNFFGGWADFNDCDDVEIDIQKKSNHKFNNHVDNETFNKFQNALLNLKPIS